MKRALLVAFHFPPLAGSSGIQRTLRFVQHLRGFGWETAVLTARPDAYDRTSDDLECDVPRDVIVERAFALDAARQLAVRGRYPGFLARPDRWMTWQFDAVRVGMRLIHRWKPHVLWSTYPIATAHVIGERLHRRSRLPWIADFRDPMAQEGYPADPRTWRQFKRIEELAVSSAKFSTFTTPGAAREYRNRYARHAERIVVLENGFDEESFALAETAGAGAPRSQDPRIVTLLHSGVVYPSERDPTCLMIALRRLAEDASALPRTLRVRFRAAAHDEMLARLANEHGVTNMIELLPPIPYREALDEMMHANALLVLQASNCNAQIPAKLYEYLRAGRPILALTDRTGDTAAVMREAGLDTIAPLDSVDEIVALLKRLIVRPHALPLPSRDYVARASRLARTRELADLLDAAASG